MDAVTVTVSGDNTVICVGLTCPDRIIGYDGNYYYATYDDHHAHSNRIRVYIEGENRLIRHCEIGMAFSMHTDLHIYVIGGYTYLQAGGFYYKLLKDFTICEAQRSVRHEDYLYREADVITNRFIYRNSYSYNCIYAIDRIGDANREIPTDDISAKIREVSSHCVVVESDLQWMYLPDDGKTKIIRRSTVPDLSFVAARGIISLIGPEVVFIDLENRHHILHQRIDRCNMVSIYYNGDHVAVVEGNLLKVYSTVDTPSLIHEGHIQQVQGHNVIFNSILPRRQRPGTKMSTLRPFSDIVIMTSHGYSEDGTHSSRM